MHRTVSRMYKVFREEDAVAARATFIIDKKGIIRHMVINDLDLPRNQDELVRIIKHIENK